MRRILIYPFTVYGYLWNIKMWQLQPASLKALDNKCMFDGSSIEAL